MTDKVFNVLSLGAGKQSTYMLLRGLAGDFGEKPDYAVFSDTGSEPTYVYDYLEFLIPYVKEKFGFTIDIVSGGNLMQDTLDYLEGKNQRGASMPLFIKESNSPLRRQCTHDYKIAPIRKYFRKLRSPYRRGQKPSIRLWIGISLDEIERMKKSETQYITNYYPLIENRVTIDQIKNWYHQNGIREPGKSACIACPFHSDNYWKRYKKAFPEDFKKAVEFDKKIRNLPNMDSETFVHKSCKPLDEIDFEYSASLFPELIEECEGLCGL